MCFFVLLVEQTMSYLTPHKDIEFLWANRCWPRCMHFEKVCFVILLTIDSSIERDQVKIAEHFANDFSSDWSVHRQATRRNSDIKGCIMFWIVVRVGSAYYLCWLNAVFDTCVSFTFFSQTLDPSVVKNGSKQVNNTNLGFSMVKLTYVLFPWQHE